MNNSINKRTQKSNSNKNEKASPINLIVEMKVRSLVVLWGRARLLQTALKEYDTGVAFPGEIESILYNDNNLLNKYSEIRDRNRKVLDIDTARGQKELEKTFINVRSFKIDIHKRECFDRLLEAILQWGRYIYKNMPQEYFLLFTKIDDDLRQLSCEAIGYWTAKLIEMKKNQTNAQERTVRSNANTAAIAKILGELGIDNLGEFRANKELRNKFMEECRSATRELDKTKPPQPLSDERIMKKAREHIKARRFNIVLPAKATERPSKRR